jgi:hypothetical protein
MQVQFQRGQSDPRFEGDRLNSINEKLRTLNRLESIS